MFGAGRDGGRGETLRGAAIILGVGLVLGVAYNALALGGRPPRGLAWVDEGPPPRPTLESMQPGAGPTDSLTVDPHAGHDHGSDATGGVPATIGVPSTIAPRSTPTTPAPSSRAGTAPATGASRTGAATPAATAARSDIPVVPDVPGPIDLELPSLKKLYDANAAFIIDAREIEQYQEGHIAGAVSLPYNDALAEPSRVQQLDPKGRPIVIYCSGVTCEVSLDLAQVLIQAGKRRVLVFKGGYPEWQSAGYPVTRGSAPGARP